MSTSLNIAFQNQTGSSTVFAYITGLQNNAWFLLCADGKTPYFPTSPSADLSPLTENCAIPLGAPGNTVNVTIPQLDGGRIWFSVDSPLTFLLNKGPALVFPSVTNSSDPNFNTNWGFCEFTFNNAGLYANISCVDFVSIPIALTLQNTSGGIQHVSGMPVNGLDNICAGLRQQAQLDGQHWDKLIVTANGKNLRALSPNSAMVMNGSLFAGYYEGYVQQVWQKYSSVTMRINPQDGSGIKSGDIQNGNLVFAGQEFSQPTTADIFSCNSGPFQTGSDEARKAIIPRLAAAFVRSTLLSQNVFPEDQSTYYKTDPTDHYSRIVHENNLDGKGYAFPYDDVQPDGGNDQSGKVNDRSPQLFTVAVGGGQAHAGGPLPPQHDELRRDAPAKAPAKVPA